MNFDSSDAHGTYEAATQLSIRGFLTDQMGYTLDGVPLGNMQYRNNNGLSVNRAILSENNGAATLSQGSGVLGTASTSNIGGTVDFTSIDPTSTFGVDFEQSYGWDFDNIPTFALADPYDPTPAAFVASTSSGPFSSSSQAGFNYIRNDLKLEMTNTFEAGYRFHNNSLQFSHSAYAVHSSRADAGVMDRVRAGLHAAAQIIL